MPSGCDGLDPRDGVGIVRLGMIEAVAPAVDDLLDREQGDEDSGERDRGVKRGDRRVRGQAETAEAAKEIEIAEINEAAGHRQNHKASDNLDGEASIAVHRLGEGGQIQMIVSSCRRRRSGKNSIDEESRGYFLQPEPRIANRARKDVERY